MRVVGSKGDKIAFVVSSITIVLAIVFLFFVVRYRPMLGDDVLGLFNGSFSLYTSENPEVGERISSFQDIMNHSIDNYLYWSGRILYIIINGLLVPRNITVAAVFVCGVYLGIILASISLFYGSLKEAMHHPFTTAVVTWLLLFYNRTLRYGIMRTFAELYGVSLLLYLCLMMITKKIIEDKEYSTGQIILINIFGFITGITHELIGAWFILQMGSMLLWKFKLKSLLKAVKYYIGFTIGYCICFFAPGNFNRMGLSHDEAIHSAYFPRLKGALSAHINYIFKYESVGKYIFGILILLFILELAIQIKKRNKEVLRQFIWYEVFVAISVLLWSVVSYTPSYGLLGPMLYQFFAFFTVIADISFERKQLVFIVLAGAIMFFSVVDLLSWIPQMVQESINREVLISEAVNEGKEEVYVPRYSENITARNIMFAEYIDNSAQYETDYYIKYYGTRVVIQ